MKFLVSCVTVVAAWAMAASASIAGVVLAAATFEGRIDRWDPSQGASGISTFSNIASQTSIDASLMNLSGIAFNPVSQRLLVADNNNRLFELNPVTGNVIRTVSVTGFAGPSGIAVGANGRVYISNLNSGQVTVFDAALSSSSQLDVGAGTPIQSFSGIAFAPQGPQGSLVLSTFGGGIFRYDLNSSVLSPLNSNYAAQGSAAIASDGTTYVGSIIDLANFLNPSDPAISNVYRFDASGNATGQLTIDSNLLPPPAGFETRPTSPGAVTFDDQGRVVVGALGRTSIRRIEPNNGGLFIFDPSVFNGGTASALFSATGTSAYGAVYFSAVPEPSSLLALTTVLGSAGLMWRRRRKVKADSRTDSTFG